MKKAEKVARKNDSSSGKTQQNTEKQNKPVVQNTILETLPFAIGETPYLPSVQRHSEMLSNTADLQHRALVFRQLQQTYGNNYVQRLIRSSAPATVQKIGQQPVVQRDKEEFERNRAKIGEFFSQKPRSNSGPSEETGAKPENKVPESETESQKPETEESSSDEEYKATEPFEYKPDLGINVAAYHAALEKFQEMKKSRLRGGLSKSRRKLAAQDYLRDRVEAAGSYAFTQTIVNGIMQAYKETFGADLKFNQAEEDLEKTEVGRGSMEKAGDFAFTGFHFKKWFSWIKNFIEYCRDPQEAVAEKAPQALPGFLSFAQPVADKIAKFTKWFPVAGIITSLVNLVLGIKNAITKSSDMKALESTAKTAGKKEDEASSSVAQAAQYGYAKVKRGFLTQLYYITKAAANIVIGVAKLVVGLITGGPGALIVEAIDLSLTLVTLAIAAGRKLKGLYKWITGKRGKARRENAKKIVMAAKAGSEDAMNLIVKLDPSGSVRGDRLNRFMYWLENWGEKKKAQDKLMLMQMMNTWDDAEIKELVRGLAVKLKSQ